MPALPPEQRFLRLTDQNDDGCWYWLGHAVGSKSRYPRFRPTTNQHDPQVYAHRWAYEHWVGPIPEGMELDHTCRHPMCVNPAHLEPVSPAVNSERARLTVCRAGLHDLTDAANLRWDAQGRRRGCLRCWESSQRARVRTVPDRGR